VVEKKVRKKEKETRWDKLFDSSRKLFKIQLEENKGRNLSTEG